MRKIRIYDINDPVELLRRKKISETLKKKFTETPHWTKGQTAWNKGMELWWKTNGSFKKGMIPWNKGKKVPQISGSNNCNWSGGFTKEYQKIRSSPEMREFRKQIFIRDKFTCQHCGQVGGQLEVHHIKPFCLYPQLRFESTNGITLCKNCHSKTDTYKRAALNFIQK